jgi:hypothetical protein
MKKLESGKQQLQQLQNELRAIEQSARRDIEASESTDAPVATAPATTAAASAPQAPAPAESGTASGDRPA